MKGLQKAGERRQNLAAYALVKVLLRVMLVGWHTFPLKQRQKL
jgi:hypothetical protein